MFEALLEKIASALKKAKIDYMVIGGQAVLIHGEPRLTRDIDVTLAVDIDRLPEIQKLIVGLQLRNLVEKPEEFVRATRVLPVTQYSSGLRIDLMFSHSEFERTAISRARPKKVGSTSVMFASLEDLVIHKTIAGRPRDIEDIKSVLLKNPEFDKEYIVGWLRKIDYAQDAGYLSSFRSLLKTL